MNEDAPRPAPATEPAADPSLAAVAEIARQRGHEAIARQAEGLLARAAEGRFFLAVIGQFKRGKSTLVNALLEAPHLPTGVVPVTAVVTIVEYGSQPGALVEFRDGSSRPVPLAQLAEFITEEGNPGNREGVAAVVVRCPAPLLRSGLCLVDTPGLGSVFELSTEATHAFVPKIDAALVVLGPDPPISADELSLVERIASEVSDLLYVLNKSDAVDREHLAEAAAFCARVLQERLSRPAEILCVSARRALNEPAGSEPGFQELRTRLEVLAEGSGARLVRRAIERGARRLADELSAVIELDRRALTDPLGDSQQRIDEFRRRGAELGRMLHELDYLLRAEVDMTERWLQDEVMSFVGAQRKDLGLSLMQRFDSLGAMPRARLRHHALLEVKAELKLRLDAWLKSLEPRVQQQYRRLTDRFVEAANASASGISAAASRILGLSIDPAPPEPGLRAPSRLYYRLEAEALFLDPSDAWMRLRDRLSPRSRVLARVRAWARERADHLLVVNAARIADGLKERIEESLRCFRFEMADRLERALRTAEDAQARAKALRSAGTAAVAGELSALEGALGSLQRLRASVGADPAR